MSGYNLNRFQENLYKESKNIKIKDRLKIIKKTIETNNYELFNYVLDDYNISKEFWLAH